MRNKYNAKKTKVGNVTYDSKAEARRGLELSILEEKGIVKDVERQKEFKITDFIYVKKKDKRYKSFLPYKSDFAYFEGETYVVEDVKGFQSDVYKFKRRFIIDYCLEQGYTFREVMYKKNKQVIKDYNLETWEKADV